MTNFQLLTLIGTIVALLAGQTTVILWHVNYRFGHVDKELSEVKALTNHFIDLSMNHGERLATLEERTGGQPKKP